MGTRHIGRYEILRELGRGGMATVYLARDPAFDRQVAVKILPAQFTHDPQFLARFRREARVIAGLEHAYVVPVYDYGEDAGQPFLVLRYMAGGSLTDRMQTGPMPLEEVLQIVTRLAEALDEAHQHGIVHRDLKPANILFDGRGLAYLSDFGIAKMVAGQGTESLTGTGIIGTPAYMSPEQAVGDRPLDSRSDIYSFGIVIYEMLTGRPPFKADTPMRLLFKHVTEPVPQLPAQELDDLALPPELNAILARALAKDPDGRFQTASALTTPLTRLAHSQAGHRRQARVQAQPAQLGPYSETAPTQRSPLSRAGLPWPWILGGIGVLLAAIGWVALSRPGGSSEAGDGTRQAPPSATWTAAGETVFTPAAPITTSLLLAAPAQTETATVTPPSPTPTGTTTSTATGTASSTETVTVTVTPPPTLTRAVQVVRPTATWTPVPPPTPTDTPQPPPNPEQPVPAGPSPTDTPAQ